MIKLKNGLEIKYNKDIDRFFKNLVEATIKESLDAVLIKLKTKDCESDYDELFFKEIMDNSIFITHQLFELSKTDIELSKFLITGFIFNNIIQLYTESKKNKNCSTGTEDSVVH